VRRLIFNSAYFDQCNSALNFDQIWNLPVKEQVTKHRTSDVAIVRIQQGDQGEIIEAYRKRYWYPGFKKKVKGFFRNTCFKKSRAKVEYKNLILLKRLSLSQITPFAFGEERCFRFLNRAVIITERIPGAISIDEFVSSGQFNNLPFQEKKIFLCGLGRWVAALHLRGYRDRGLYTRNIIVCRYEEGWRFSKIDSPKGYGGNKAPGTGAPYLIDLKDIYSDLRLKLNRTDRLRCFQSYLGKAKLDQAAKTVINEIVGNRQA